MNLFRRQVCRNPAPFAAVPELHELPDVKHAMESMTLLNSVVR